MECIDEEKFNEYFEEMLANDYTHSDLVDLILDELIHYKDICYLIDLYNSRNSSSPVTIKED